MNEWSFEIKHRESWEKMSFRKIFQTPSQLT